MAQVSSQYPRPQRPTVFTEHTNVSGPQNARNHGHYQEQSRQYGPAFNQPGHYQQHNQQYAPAMNQHGHYQEYNRQHAPAGNQHAHYQEQNRQYAPSTNQQSHYPEHNGRHTPSSIPQQPAPRDDGRSRLMVLPMFPLKSAAEEAARQKVAAQQAELLGFVQPVPEQTMTDKLALGLISATGGTVFNMKKVDNAGMTLAAASQGMLAANVATATLTRWILPEGNGSLLVDVIEFRGYMKLQSNPIYAKVSSDVRLRVGGKSPSKVKRTGMFKKTWNFKPVESLSIIDENGTEREMVILLRLESPTSPIEWTEQIKRFEQTWNVPHA